MTTELGLVLGLLAAAVVMFALGRPRMDAVALIMLVALPFTGVVTVPETLAGFADPNIILIAALFVIGEGLVRTGVAQGLGDWLARRAGTSEPRLIALLMLVAGGIGAFMSSTGVVAIFIPIVLRIARRAAIPAGRLMMPLSMAALISGMLTLVATAPNLVVHAELMRRGHEGFGFFDFTPFGLPILALAVIYMILARRLLGPGQAQADPQRRPLSGWVEEYDLAGRERRLRLLPGSPLAGQRLDTADLRGSAGINIIAIERPGRFRPALVRPTAATVLQAGDVLFLDLQSGGFDVAGFARSHGLQEVPLTGRYFHDASQEIGMAEVMIPATSRMIGQTVTGLRFRSRYGLAVIGMKHGSIPVAGPVTGERLRAGDTLLTVGPWRAIRRLQEERRDLLLLDLPAEFDDAVPARSRAPMAVGVLVLVIALMVTGAVPNVLAALIGCLLLGLAGCIDMTAAYRSIHWQSLILIVGMLPFSIALDRTGGIEIAAGALVGLAGDAGPRLMLAMIFVATAVLGLFISNTATAVLMAPVALAIAEGLGASPYPFAMTVALAASAAFMTPVSSPVNTLVVGPGGYGFGDFLRLGVPFTIITLGVAVLLVPVLLPF
ncbi:SLC13 family permease [Halodurantibacterium flavum]|uniref:SLC13 family permease n=1 Tax=Halodurantibacterium flavum TaxID=1382802 RepID=A0ABW4S1P0_9RHOB